ncbi:MAG: LPS export ABC transporter ATP-binding protein [Lentisphaeria bacterium]|nr:LPS export ABC transporter ATP-binding protein [Lentisphaeria bacterium]
MAEPILLKTEQLKKSYKGKTVVKGVDFFIRKGEVVGLLGPNGAGKTTSFYMVIGLVEPDSGKVFFEGEDVSEMPMYQRARLGMGYLSQEPSIFRNLTVEDNVMCILETLDLSQEERKRRLKFLLEGLGLETKAKQKAMTLSGGESRRLEITRALVTNPSFIMLDEPFNAIDPKTVHEVQKMIAQLKAMGMGVLITDHSVRETLDIVDRGYIMSEGEILCEGTRDYLINDPKAKEVYLGENFSV